MSYVVVDGYSTGGFLAERLRSYGVKCIHVQSSSALSSYFLRSYRSERFARDLGSGAGPAAVARSLSGEDVAGVIAGAESGVEFAERLARILGMPTNDVSPSRVRRDKSVMAQALRAAGLRAPDGVVVGGPGQAVEWLRESGHQRVVVKPVDSAASDHVFFCDGPADVRAACARVLSARNLFGRPNRVALVQERLSGPEYYVNTVTVAGRHRAVETWRYTKRPGPADSPLYDYEEPVDRSAPAVDALHEYVGRALTALGVTYGAAHSELVLTADGPVLLETAARLGGAVLPHVVEKFVGFSQVSLLAEVLVCPDRLESFDEWAWHWPRPLRNVFLINRRHGVAGPLTVVDSLRTLPSFVDLVMSVEAGQELPATADLASSPGYVYLSADSLPDIDADYRRIRSLEAGDAYLT